MKRGLWGLFLEFINRKSTSTIVQPKKEYIDNQNNKNNSSNGGGDMGNTSTQGVKRSLHIGINDYKGTRNDLKGCVNDANAWKNKATINGFSDITTILDGQGTIHGVQEAFNGLTKRAVDGDTVLITYSGHGSTTVDLNGDEEDGKDETWYLYDGHYTDDNLRDTIGNFREGVKVIVISDSCNSGTVTRAMLSTLGDEEEEKEEYCKVRYMPPEDDEEGIMLAALPVKKKIINAEEDMREILLSGCLSTEFSYDARFNGKPMGAFTYAAMKILDANPIITYQDFYDKVRKELPSRRYGQTPQLEGSAVNKQSVMFE